MRKRFLAISMATVMMLCMAGCGKKNGSSETSATVSQVATESDSFSSVKVAGEDDMFSDRDYDISYDDAEEIALADGSSSTKASGVSIEGDVVTITKAGSYKLSGELSDGQIIVDVADDEKVQLVLDGVKIENDDSAVIYVKNADKVFVTTTESENSLSVTGEFAESEDGVDAVIYAKDDITLNGAGTLNISCETSHGISGKDDVKITSGIYNIDVAKKGIDANDSVRVADGTINITSGTDGIHVENTDDETLGFFYAIGGTFNIEAGYDGIDTSGEALIYDGDYNIVSGGGYENGAFHSDNMMGGGFGGQQNFENEQNVGGRPGLENGEFDGQMPDAASGENFGGGRRGRRGENTQGEQQNSGSGMEGQSSDGSNMSEMTPPDMADGQMPEDMTPPDMAGDRMSEDMTTPEMQGTEATDDPSSETQNDSTNNTKKTDGSQITDTSETTEETEYDADDYLENSTKGIKADGGIYIYGGTYTIDAADDTIHSDNEVTIDEGSLTLSSGDDGIHADVIITLNGGNIDISSSYEGVEAHTIEINGGDINLVASDDGLNAGGDTDASLSINGGILHISAGGDCVDSNGNLVVTGGETYVSGPNNGGNGSIDYEVNGYITGGTFITAGASGMAMNFGQDSTQCSILYELSGSVESGTTITLSDSDGNEIASYTPDKAYQSIVISSPDIESDGTYTLTVGSETYTIEMSGTIYGQGTGMGGFGGMGGNGMMPGGGF